MARALSRWLTLPIATAMVLSSVASCSSSASVRSVTTALDGQNDRPRNTFYPDTNSIFCNVEFVGQKRDTTLQVFIRQIRAENGWGGPLQASNVLVGGQEYVPQPGSQIVSFSLQHPSTGSDQAPYPVGVFQCEVQVNGELASIAQFQIVYPNPDCPPLGATAGTVCRGYHRPNASCAGNNQAQKCSCDPNSGKWSCP